MADIAPIPFINFGLQQAQQADATASAGLKGQEAAVQQQQARSAKMAADLQQRAMPMYQQNIDDMLSQMNPTAANSNEPTGEHMPSQQQPDQSGVQQQGNGVQSYADSGAIAEHIRQQNWVQPLTPQEAQRLKQGALLATMPGGNPTFFEQAKLQREYRVQQQTNAAQYRSGQTYDVMTAVADQDNKDPLGMLGSIPGQEGVVARIKQDYGDNEQGAQDAARKYANMTAFHTHQYTGNPTDMQNGVLVDTKKGAPVTGQQQVMVGMNGEQKDKYLQWANQPIPVKFTDGTSQDMPRWRAPKEQGGFGGVTPDAMMRREDAQTRQSPGGTPGSTTWDAPDAPGNSKSGVAAQQAGTPTRYQQPPSGKATGNTAPGAKPAVGAALQANTVPGHDALAAAPSPTGPQGPAPAYGTPQYGARLNAGLNDTEYKAKFAPQNLPHIPGAPMPGVEEGVKNYQDQVKELRSYSGTMSQSASQALMNFNAAKQILANPNSPLPVSGPIGALAQKVAATTGTDINSATVRQEVTKYLTNASLAQLKETYGSRPAMFDVKVNLEQAFPNIDKMDPKSAMNLIDSQIKQANYLKQSSERAISYSQRGLEPNSFPTWNEKYFPRDDLVTKPSGPPPGAESRSYQGKNYYLTPGADRSKRENWIEH